MNFLAATAVTRCAPTPKTCAGAPNARSSRCWPSGRTWSSTCAGCSSTAWRRPRSGGDSPPWQVSTATQSSRALPEAPVAGGAHPRAPWQGQNRTVLHPSDCIRWTAPRTFSWRRAVRVRGKRPGRAADGDPRGTGAQTPPARLPAGGTAPSRPTSLWQRKCQTTSLQDGCSSAGAKLSTLRTVPPARGRLPDRPHHPSVLPCRPLAR